MASTRLTNNHRDVLKALVTRIVDCPIEIKAEAAAYAKAAPMVRKIVEMKYPAAEMKVLDKYRCALLDECVRIQHPDGSVQQFTFRKGDAPNVPNHHSCSQRMYLSDERQQKAVEAWVDAATALKDGTQKKREDYNAFIHSAGTFEQLIEIWPEAVQVADRIKVNLPATVNPEMLARIKADSAARMRRAA
jgi:hypothetical protein